ncbi:MAG: hypothetical protein EBZ11_07905, partial [Alphaproteobacteria bacterium]|nr:hypothetical protein [Alphaproteobacteria bacterium]
DPFLLGRIAAVHALSDLYAALATPTSALAIINLPEASLTIQTNQLTQILAGGLCALSEDGVRLNGGHTSEGGALSVGFSVTGYCQAEIAAQATKAAQAAHGDDRSGLSWWRPCTNRRNQKLCDESGSGFAANDCDCNDTHALFWYASGLC